MKFLKGNVFEEQSRNGWIYGHFMPEGLAHDDHLEIKIAKLDNAFTSKPHYNKSSTKIDIIWEGEAIWEVDGKEIEVNSGSYLIIPPGTSACIKKVLSKTITVQTIRTPSIPDDKVMV